MTTEPMEKFETRMTTEATRTAITLFLEEVSRQMLRIGIEDQARQFLSNACSFTGSVSFHLLRTQSAFKALWESLRSQPGLFDVIMRTTVKLRGMYSSDDWRALTDAQIAALSVLALNKSVADDAVKTHFINNERAEYFNELVYDNPWVVTLLLVDHLQIREAPVLLNTVLKEIAKPKSTEVKQQ